MSHLRQEDVRALEQARQRLYQLTQSIGSLKNDVIRTSPMPQWDSIQISASILAQNLKSITDHLALHRELFKKTLVYPSTNFPGRTQENLVGHLLRKKLEPSVEAWVEEGRALERQEAPSEGNDGGAGGKDDLDELWTFAKDFIVPRVVEAARMHRRENYTVEEQERGIENVKTGLRVPPKLRQVEDDDDGDEDEDDDDEDDDDGDQEMKDRDAVEGRAPARKIEEIARFMVTGMMPEDEPHLYQQETNVGGRR